HPFVIPQYVDSHMGAWRQYIRGLAGVDHRENVRGSKADTIRTRVSAFLGKSLSYSSTRTVGDRHHLYLDVYQSSAYDYIEALLTSLTAHDGTLFLPHGHDAPLVLNLGSGPTHTRGYVCGDSSQYWINHFDSRNRMTNIFIVFPDYLP